MKYLKEEDQKKFALINELRARELTREEITAEVISHFDWSYDYSDCSATWRSGVEQEKKLFAFLDQEYPDPTDARWRLQRGLTKTTEAQAEFRANYPFLDVYGYLGPEKRNLFGMLGAALDGVSEEAMGNVLEFTRKYKEEIQPLLGLSYHDMYRFVRTKAAPTAEFLRMNGHKTLAVNQKAQDMIFELFDSPTIGETLKLIKKYRLENGLNFIFEQVDGAVNPHVRIQYYDEGGWKSYQFFYRAAV